MIVPGPQIARPEPFPKRILPLLKVPGGTDEASLVIDGDALIDPVSGERYPFFDGVPSLFQAHDTERTEVTNKVKSFYEEHPFPDYEGLEEFGELVTKGLDNPFSAELLAAIGHNKLILECGCGTGQLSHFLQLNNNNVLGVDMSLGSLQLAIEHKMRNALDRVAFAQMNIFELAIKDESFDVVISHGVLHHTYDARKAFSCIVKKAKPGGIVLVGLYNSIARIPTWLRSKVIGLFGQNIDYVVRNRIHNAKKADTWIKDQYYNPHETWHSIGEVMTWFEEEGIDFLNCSPPVLGTSGELASDMFEQTDPGNWYQRAVTQTAWLSSIAREGALFDVVGRKK